MRRAAGVPASRGRAALAIAAGVAAALIYAGQFVVSRYSMQRTLTLWDLAAIRFTVAGLLLLPLALRHGLRRAAGIGWPRAIVLAVGAGGPYTLIMYSGLVLAPAGHGAVIIPGITPVVSTVLLWMWLGQRPWRLTVSGLVLIVGGVVLVGWPAMHGAGGRTWLGDLIFVVAGVLWGLIPVLMRRWQIDPWRGTAIVWVLALAYVPVYAVLGGTHVLQAPAGEIVFQALYQGVGVAIVALVLYGFAIRVLGATFGSLFMPLVPVFGVLLAIPALGEVPMAVQVVGMLAVSAGMGLAAVRRGA